jgi:hypothetical protein
VSVAVSVAVSCRSAQTLPLCDGQPEETIREFFCEHCCECCCEKCCELIGAPLRDGSAPLRPRRWPDFGVTANDPALRHTIEGVGRRHQDDR